MTSTYYVIVAILGFTFIYLKIVWKKIHLQPKLKNKIIITFINLIFIII